MLSYNELYNIASGIHYAFKSSNSKRMLTIKHSSAKREKLRLMFPESKFALETKENFIIACLYVGYTYNVSSQVSFFEKLREVDIKETYKFKNEIIHYRKFLSDDLELLYNEDLEYSNVSNLYRVKKIKWFTWYFYLLASNNLERSASSRIDGVLLKKIQKLLLYVSFSEKTLVHIKELLSKNLLKYDIKEEND